LWRVGVPDVNMCPSVAVDLDMRLDFERCCGVLFSVACLQMVPLGLRQTRGRGDYPMARYEGTCHLCGKVGPLSFEHVPPRRAFNDQPVRQISLEGSFQFENERAEKGAVSQRGAGAYTLCERCNNLTGKWYAKDFVKWCGQGAEILVRSEYRPTLIYLHYVLPLRVLKQILTMCFSMNTPSWRESVPELEQFVLDRDRRWLPPRYRVFVYYNVEGTMRRVGNSIAMVNLNESHDVVQVTEISHPPFGYVLTVDGSRPDDRLFEITHFQRYEYGEIEVAFLRPEILPTHLGIPLDYRSREEIENQIALSSAADGPSHD